MPADPKLWSACQVGCFVQKTALAVILLRGTEGSLLHGHSAVAALSKQTGFVPLAVVYALGQTLYWRRLVPMLPLGLALVVRLGKLVYEG